MLGPNWGNTGNFFFKPPRPLAIALPNRHGGRRYAFPPYACWEDHHRGGFQTRGPAFGPPVPAGLMAYLYPDPRSPLLSTQKASQVLATVASV